MCSNAYIIAWVGTTFMCVCTVFAWVLFFMKKHDEAECIRKDNEIDAG